MAPRSALVCSMSLMASPVTDEFPSQMPVMGSFDVFFDLRLNKRLSKQSWRQWFETRLCSLWRHCNQDSVGEFSDAMGSFPQCM